MDVGEVNRVFEPKCDDVVEEEQKRQQEGAESGVPEGAGADTAPNFEKHFQDRDWLDAKRRRTSRDTRFELSVLCGTGDRFFDRYFLRAVYH